jgi:hypothetical protein
MLTISLQYLLPISRQRRSGAFVLAAAAHHPSSPPWFRCDWIINKKPSEQYFSSVTLRLRL